MNQYKIEKMLNPKALSILDDYLLIPFKESIEENQIEISIEALEELEEKLTEQFNIASSVNDDAFMELCKKLYYEGASKYITHNLKKMLNSLKNSNVPESDIEELAEHLCDVLHFLACKVREWECSYFEVGLGSMLGINIDWAPR